MTVERKNMATVKAAAASYPYIEDVFSTYLYTGTGNATNTITNSIDLSTNGGLVWIKYRGLENHFLWDTSRGVSRYLNSDTTSASTYFGSGVGLTAFNTNGFSVYGNGYGVNNPGLDYVSWTFRKQAKFFDVVSYTGTGSATTIAHNLGATPGMIIVKRTDTTANWRVYHSGLTSASYYMALNTTAAQALDTTIWNATAPTSSVFSIGTDATVNASGGTYIAYLFASNAGGFGAAGTDNVITCGSYTGSSGTKFVTLGWEPQFLLVKNITSGSASSNWALVDILRGMAIDSNSATLRANLSSAESSLSGDYYWPTATGFADGNSSSSQTYIYMAIRRGPMKTPTSGTSVFTPIARTGTSANATISTGFVVDAVIERSRIWSAGSYEWSRLQGPNKFLITSATVSEDSSYTDILTSFANNTGVQVGADASLAAMNNSNALFKSYINWFFSRAPGFLDVVCYTGTGSATTITHNLGVVPELIIVKCRSTAGTSWPVYNPTLGNTKAAFLNAVGGSSTSSTYWNNTSPTSSVFTVGSNGDTNGSARTYVAYLFATLAGVSKVGTYAGSTAAQNIDCGFAAGARFVMIKQYTSNGDWFIWDSARGISASGTNDPYLLMNSSAVEVTNTDYLGTYSSGFALTTASVGSDVNANGQSYIYLAIA